MDDIITPPERIYQFYKKAMNRIEKNNEKLKELDNKTSNKPTLEMSRSHISSNINWNDEYRRQLHSANEKISEDLNDKLQTYYQDNDIPKDREKAVVSELSKRYENEKDKNLEQSQAYSFQKLGKSANKEELKNFRSNDLDQSQDKAQDLLNKQKARTNEEKERFEFLMEYSLNKMDIQLQTKSSPEKEPEKDMDIDRD